MLWDGVYRNKGKITYKGIMSCDDDFAFLDVACSERTLFILVVWTSTETESLAVGLIHSRQMLVGFELLTYRLLALLGYQNAEVTYVCYEGEKLCWRHVEYIAHDRVRSRGIASNT